MSLSDCIQGAIGGLIGGFGFGVTGLPDKFVEKAAIKQVFNPDGDIPEAGWFTSFHEMTKAYHVIAPGIVGVVTAPSPVANVASIPAAFLGYGLGKLVRDRKKGKMRRELRAFVQAQKTIGLRNAYQLALPQSTVEEIDSQIQALEDKIISGAQDSRQPVRKIYEAIAQANPHFKDEIEEWTTEKCLQVAERADDTRDIKLFYEVPSNVVRTIVFSPDREPNAQVIFRRGSNFYTHSLAIYGDSRRKALKRNSRTERIKVKEADITTGSSEKKDWDYKDVRALTRKGETTILAVWPDNVSRPDYIQIVANALANSTKS